MDNILTKSKYLIGLECPRYLWITFNQPEKIRKPTLAEEFKFKEGDKVGELAKKLFPHGINLPIDDYDENIKHTKKALIKKKPLFEAGMQFKNCFSRADILVPVKDQWDIIEVKSGTKVKDINIHDVSFQKFVYESYGLKIRKCFLMHLNKDYKKKGKLNLRKLFVKEDITSEVKEVSKDIKESIEFIFKIMSLDKPPKAGILTKKLFKDGNHDCLIEKCLELSENHVFCLYRGGKLSCELFESGVENIRDIPEDIKLNDKQGIQRNCEIKGIIHVDKDKINDFLNKLKYPVYYLDFETFSNAIPMFNDLHPYFQVPFQFSLHVVRKESAKLEHYEFLYDGNGDPRKEFILKLKKVLGNKGSIVVYNQSFEITRLKELSEHFPKYKKWIDSILDRIVDLYVPFRNFGYYNPKQHGSASIKKILPALTEKSYESMEIADGGTASVEFFNITYNKCTKEQKKKVRENLLKYCELDTLAEVLIVEKLKEIKVGCKVNVTFYCLF